jgi:hypothetical protein
VRKQLKTELDKIFGTLTADLAAYENDPKKLEEDRVCRSDIFCNWG